MPAPLSRISGFSTTNVTQGGGEHWSVAVSEGLSSVLVVIEVCGGVVPVV